MSELDTVRLQKLVTAKNDIAQSISNKGVEVPENALLDDYSGLIDSIPSGGDDTTLKGLIDGSVTELSIPEGVTQIRGYAFYDCQTLKSINIPNSVKSIGKSAFYYCKNLSSVTIPYGITIIEVYTFNECFNLKSITIPSSVKTLSIGAFSDCKRLESITIPSSVTSIGNSLFYNCTRLTNVIIDNGFNANNLNLSSSTLYTVETIVSWLEALADRIGLTSYTLTIGSTNLAKLTNEQLLIATNKNWKIV